MPLVSCPFVWVSFVLITSRDCKIRCCSFSSKNRSPMKNIICSSSAGVGEKDKKPLVFFAVLADCSTVWGSGKGSDMLTVSGKLRGVVRFAGMCVSLPTKEDLYYHF